MKKYYMLCMLFSILNVYAYSDCIPLSTLFSAKSFIRKGVGVGLLTGSAWLMGETLRDFWYGYLIAKNEAAETENYINKVDIDKRLTKKEIKICSFIQAVSQLPYIFYREWFSSIGASFLFYYGIKVLRIS